MLMKKLKVVPAAVLVTAGLIGAGVGFTLRAQAGDGPLPGIMPSTPVTVEKGQTYRTANFTVKARTREIARQVARAAEQHRKEQALLWLGKELPAWPKPCPVRVRVTSRGPGGSTSFAIRGGNVVSRHMDLEGPLKGILADALPHEVMHTVLAHWYRAPVPRWADEGISVLAESPASRSRHRRLLRTVLHEKRALSLRQLLCLREYPRDVMVLYYQGASLVDFLVRQGGRTKLLAFIRQGEKDGWARAVKARYGFNSLEDLQRSWFLSVCQDQLEEWAVTTAGGWSAPRMGEKAPKGRLPLGPAPELALVLLGKDGRLTVWRLATSYRTIEKPGDRDRPPAMVYKPVTRLVEASFAPSEVKVYDTAGTVVGAKKLRGLLKGEALALIAADGQPVDPLHLRLVKEGTLVFVLPAPPAEKVPPPAVTSEKAVPPLPVPEP